MSPIEFFFFPFNFDTCSIIQGYFRKYKRIKKKRGKQGKEEDVKAAESVLRCRSLKEKGARWFMMTQTSEHQSISACAVLCL